MFHDQRKFKSYHQRAPPKCPNVTPSKHLQYKKNLKFRFRRHFINAFKDR